MTVKHGHDCLVAIIDGSTTFQHQCKAATDRAKHNEPKRGRLFLNAIIRHLEEIIAGTARRIQVVVVFDHPILLPELKRNTVLDRQDRQQPQQPSDKSTPVTHPVPSSRTTPSPLATFVRWSEQGLLVVAAHDADPLVSASTKFGQICDVALEPNRVVLVSADSDFFMLLGADQARYRAVLSGKDRNISLVDLAVLDAHPAVWNSRQRFVASLIFGCDYFRGITRIGPVGLRGLPEQWLDAATWQSGWDGAAGALIRNVDSKPAPTEERIEENKTFEKATEASITAVSQGCRVRFEGTPHEDSSKVSRYAYAPIRRNPPLVHQPGVSSTGPLPPLSGLLTIQDPELRRVHAKARRRQAEQPARMVSTHKLAVQGTVRAAEQRICKSNDSKSIERTKATTAAEIRALFSKHSDSGSSGGGGKCPGGVIYRMLTMTGTLDDLVQEPMVPGGLRQGAHRVRRPPARTARQAEASAPPAATRNRASSLELTVDVDSALVVDESDSRSYSIAAMEIDR
ncbi:BZ3500_MvSof-1268-A1-R1_Chr1-1g00838 [Microbotryum saponariae]|uniref:BZ3500_MvSof-1268-A1-R1_Chr1-1g00838 protein n=1 Tax=Microbotryum saponariae TaxID=289078 RepID=A0A2X0MF36_9BASI|nr:BZ3500_MvSof-1268-A1-R1_Chr1-1g00838 [Microbotryum saponariae]SCZ92760.1 BZ3501_MvSof-1269-A2-R1_Chr1-1g00435 [Microbotryum saponariae]